MSGQPLISVIIPCYNASNYITSSIRSVLNQNWPRLEIVVVDDGSNDDSVKVVSENFPFVKLIKQSNQGVAAARNNGISQSNGEWIAFLDADDIWLPEKLNQQWTLLRANPEVRLSCTSWQMWQSLDQEPSAEFVKQVNSMPMNQLSGSGPSGWIYPDLLAACVVWTSTVLAHRSAFDEVGVFDTTLRIGEDYDLWMRISRVTQILRLPQPFALYRRHNESLTKSVPSINWEAVVIQSALDRWGLSSPDGSKAENKKVCKHLARTWSDFAGANLITGQRKRAWFAAIRSIKTDWGWLNGWKVLFKTAINYP